jgi:hypothetical protein
VTGPTGNQGITGNQAVTGPTGDAGGGIDVDGSLLLTEQGSAPANPAGGMVKFYTLADRVVFVWSDGETATFYKGQT